MADVPKIIDLDKVVNPHLNGGKMISYKSRYLTKPGENYGSIILAISSMIENAKGSIEELQLVAKLPPLTNDLYWQIFQPERTCWTENTTYEHVAPGIRDLQLAAKIPETELYDGFPQFYGCRVSLNPQTKLVDRDAVLVQENLQTSGFRPGNRQKMYDLAHARLILKYTAEYHALCIALKTKKPEYFQTHVLPHFKKFNINGGISAEAKKDLDEQTTADVKLATNNNANLVEEIRNLNDLYNRHSAALEVPDSIYNSLAHCDLWINNIMIQYDENLKPCKVKLVDFQIAQYQSLAHDLIFFLLSSVEAKALEENYQNFLRYFYEWFIACLKRVEVNTEQYKFESFLHEVQRVAPLEIPHALFMTKVILADSSTMPADFKDIDLNVLSKNAGVDAIVQRMSDIIRLCKKFKFF